jgi:cyclophilin family peptidyl-prolyl cis-trans isomerase
VLLAMVSVLLAMVSVLLHTACIDKENGCESWAEGGECEKNAAFMKEACPQACGICKSQPPIDEHEDPLLGRERAVMTTDHGEIVLGFYPTVAPKTVAHIIKLFRMGGYDTNHVFRVDKGFVAQVQGVDGGRRATMSKALRHEAKKNVPDEFSGTPSSAFPDVKHVRGMLSMGKFEAAGSGTSSFSMLLGNAPSLDGKYTIFGRVVSGDQARAYTRAHVSSTTAIGSTASLGVAGAQPHGGSGDEARGHLRHAQGACTLHAHVHVHVHVHVRVHVRVHVHVHCMCTACTLCLWHAPRSGSRFSLPRS